MTKEEKEVFTLLKSLEGEEEYRDTTSSKINDLLAEVSELEKDRSESFARESELREKLNKAIDNYRRGYW